MLRYAAGVSDHTRTHTHISAHLYYTVHNTSMVQPKFRSFFVIPFSSPKPLPSTYRKRMCAESNSNISFHLCRVYVCLFAVRVLDTHIHYIRTLVCQSQRKNKEQNVTQPFRFIDYLIYFVHDEPD